jgi:hypothetical protein
MTREKTSVINWHTRKFHGIGNEVAICTSVFEKPAVVQVDITISRFEETQVLHLRGGVFDKPFADIVLKTIPGVETHRRKFAPLSIKVPGNLCESVIDVLSDKKSRKGLTMMFAKKDREVKFFRKAKELFSAFHKGNVDDKLTIFDSV